jgi:hypothetical protein
MIMARQAPGHELVGLQFLAYGPFEQRQAELNNAAAIISSPRRL